MTRNRFLTGSLASIAIASACTLAMPSAQAADLPDRGCGLPAVDAVYSQVEHPAVFRTVAAQTHTEWTWERDVDVYTYEFIGEITPASVETDWIREVPGPVEYLFTRVVIDSPGIPAAPGTPEVGHTESVVVTPAVVATEWEYIHQVTDKVRWEDADWGAQNGNGNGNGWKKTGNTRETILTPAVTQNVWVVDAPATPGTPAVPEASHIESQWTTDSPGPDWGKPVDTRNGKSSTEQQTTNGDAPAGDGWDLAATREIPAVLDTVWAATAPDGYQPTGASKIADSDHQVSDASSEVSPDGDGWTKVIGSAASVTDVPESQELVSEASTEDVLISPAVPASDPCVQAPITEPTDPVVDPVVAPVVASPVETSPAATVLPNTGNDIPPWMAPTGLAAMLAGAAMIRFGRRRERS